PIPGRDEPTAQAAKTWALSGHEVWPCPDGVCPTASGLITSPDSGTGRGDPCQPPTEDVADLGTAVDNLHYLPDLLELHGAASVTSDWYDRLDGRVVLMAGRLALLKTYPCFALTRPSFEKRQAIPDGQSGIHYVVRAATHVDLLFKDVATGTIKGVRVSPQAAGQEIGLHLTMNVAPPETDLKDGDTIAHFQQFYELLPAVPAAQRLKLVYKPRASEEASPGSECPSVRFAGP
ncbi:MAG TPA: hypothetical protein VFO85_08980, partial [Vicinamibacteria bacterium]|nr:hypothetical protein [Vicinamibacteria bacterium]